MQTVHQFVCGFPPVNFCKKLALTENCRGGRNLEDVVISAAAFLVVPQNNLLASFSCRTLSKVGLEISQLNQSLTLSLLFSFRHCTTFMVQPFYGKVKAKSIGPLSLSTFSYYGIALVHPQAQEWVLFFGNNNQHFAKSEEMTF